MANNDDFKPTLMKVKLSKPKGWEFDLQVYVTYFDDTAIYSSRKPVSVRLGDMVLTWNGNNWNADNLEFCGLKNVTKINRFVKSSKYSDSVYPASEIEKRNGDPYADYHCISSMTRFSNLPESDYRVYYSPNLFDMRPLPDGNRRSRELFKDATNDIELVSLVEKWMELSNKRSYLWIKNCLWDDLKCTETETSPLLLGNDSWWWKERLSKVDYYNSSEKEFSLHGVPGPGINSGTVILDPKFSKYLIEINGGIKGINFILESIKNEAKKCEEEQDALELEYCEKASKYSVPLLTQKEYLRINNILTPDLDPSQLPTWDWSDFNAIVVNPGANQESNYWNREDLNAKPIELKGCRTTRPNKDWQFTVIVDTKGKVWKYPPIGNYVKAFKDGKPVSVFGPHVYRYKPLVYHSTYDFKRNGLRLGAYFFVNNLLLCKFLAEIEHNKYSFMKYSIYNLGSTFEMDNYLLTHEEFID
jgi:hypothetical protein